MFFGNKISSQISVLLHVVAVFMAATVLTLLSAAAAFASPFVRVVFNSGDGIGAMAAVDASSSGVTYTIPDCAFYRPGYDFDGWQGSDGNAYDPADTVSMSTTSSEVLGLRATWVKSTGNSASAVDGVYDIYLRAGETVDFGTLPAGTTYQIWEETPGGWIVSSVNAAGEIQPLVDTTSTFTNTFSPLQASLTLAGSKTFDGQNSNAGGYEFKLEDQNGNEFFATSRQDGSFQFSPITYTTAGTYTYTITEVVPLTPDASVSYDTHTEYVTVNVASVDGVLTASAVYDADGIKFANASVPGSLVVRKSTVGAVQANEDTAFSFTVSLTDAHGDPISETSVSVASTLATPVLGKAPSKLEELAADAGIPMMRPAGTKNGTSQNLQNEDGIYTITLQGGQEAMFAGLPAGASYTIIEAGIVQADGVSIRALPAQGWACTTPSVTSEVSGAVLPGQASVAAYENTYSATGDVEIEAWKDLAGRALVSGEFVFELLDENGVVLDTVSNGAPESNGEHAGCGAIRFSPVGVSAPGIYIFQIREKIPASPDPNIVYDTGVLEVSVEMIDDGCGNIEVRRIGAADGGYTQAVAYTDGDDTFNNSLTPSSITLSKAIEDATDVSENTEFTFDIAIQNVQGQSVPRQNYEILLYDDGEAPEDEAEGFTSSSADNPPANGILVVFEANGGYFADGVAPDVEHAAQNRVSLSPGAAGGKTVGEGTSYAEPTTDVDGKSFAGWYTDAACSAGNEFDWNAYLVENISSNISEKDRVVVVYAGWSYDPVGVAIDPADVTTRAGGLSIRLSGGQRAVVNGVPQGATYSITEAVMPDGWTQENAENENGTALASGTQAAARFTNRYSASGEGIIEASKVLNGADLRDGQFSFELRDEFGALIQRTENDAAGSIVFDPIHYTQADHGKDFTYYIYETVGSRTNTEYDESAHKVVISVVDNGDGTMTATTRYFDAEGNEIASSIFENFMFWYLPMSGGGVGGVLGGIGAVLVVIGCVLALRRKEDEPDEPVLRVGSTTKR